MNPAVVYHEFTMKGILLLVYLINIVYGTSGNELYRVLNISCYEENEPRCDRSDSSPASTKVRLTLLLTN